MCHSDENRHSTSALIGVHVATRVATERCPALHDCNRLRNRFAVRKRDGLSVSVMMLISIVSNFSSAEARTATYVPVVCRTFHVHDAKQRRHHVSHNDVHSFRWIPRNVVTTTIMRKMASHTDPPGGRLPLLSARRAEVTCNYNA